MKRTRLHIRVSNLKPALLLTKAVIFCCTLGMVTACVALPVLHDDFSEMGNDVFSKLLRDSFRGDGSFPTNRIRSGNDEDIIMKRSREIFLGRKKLEVAEVFAQGHGSCVASTKIDDATGEMINISICDVVRQWNYKRTDLLFDKRRLTKPTAQLIYYFLLSKRDDVIDFELEIKNITKVQD